MRRNIAKRLECVRLAGAFVGSRSQCATKKVVVALHESARPCPLSKNRRSYSYNLLSHMEQKVVVMGSKSGMEALRGITFGTCCQSTRPCSWSASSPKRNRKLMTINSFVG